MLNKINMWKNLDWKMKKTELSEVRMVAEWRHNDENGEPVTTNLEWLMVGRYDEEEGIVIHQPFVLFDSNYVEVDFTPSGWLEHGMFYRGV